MRSVADELRTETADRVSQLPVLDRIELALALGRDDLALYAQASGMSLDAARRAIIAHRRVGRHHSQAADPGR